MLTDIGEQKSFM